MSYGSKAAAVLLFLGACAGGGELREATERRRAEAATLPADTSRAVPAEPAGEYRVPAFLDGSAPAAPAKDAPAVTAAADTAPGGWSASRRESARQANRSHTLHGVRVGRNAGFDRLVLDFGAGPVPPYRIEYVDSPVRQCGTGDPVPLPGQGWLMVMLRATQAHDDQGRATVTRRNFDPATPMIRAVRMVCDFEGHVEIALAVQKPTPFRVLLVPSPNRLIVDVRQ